MTSSRLLLIIISALESSRICREAVIEEIQEFSVKKFLIKLRTNLRNELKLQIRIYINESHIDYSYQVFDDSPLMRWYNSEHFPEISTYPNHFHHYNGQVMESPLTGDVEKDIEIVLNFLTEEDYSVK